MGNCSGYGGSPRNGIIGALFAVLLFVALLLFPRTASAAGVVSPQVFTRGSFVYVVDQKQIAFLSMDTRSAHTIYSAADSLFDIVSVVRSGDMIWTSNGMGAVAAVNMQTGTIEDFSRGFVSGGGYIDVDRRFVWLAASDTLYRMDLTSREWVKLLIPSKNSASTVRGLLSFNEQVHVITSDAVHILTTASEDWVTVPHKGFTLTAGDVRRAGDAVYFTQDKALYRYDPSKKLFVGAPVKERIRAVSVEIDNVYVAAGNRVYTLNTTNFSLEPGPAIPVLRNVYSITRDNSSMICAAGMGLVTYTSPFNLSVAPYPDHITVDGDVFVFMCDAHTILYTRGGFVIYNSARKLWSSVRIRNRGNAARKGLYGWDEDGAHVTFSDKYVGTPSGTATIREQAGAVYADDDGTALDIGSPLPNVTLNLRTEDLDGRILDLTVDNAATTLPPQKGFYYKGIEGDVLSRASFGVQGAGLAWSNVTPGVITEGASAVFSSPAAPGNRDRSLVTAAAGSGYVLSSTEWRYMGYSPDALYPILYVGETREVVASTVKMYVDGIPLPATDFVYIPETRVVRLLRREKANPTSIIQIAFAERIYPADRVVLEPLPAEHFGQYNFVEGAVSPRDWMGARVGFLTLDRNGGDLSTVALAGIPIEWRGAGGRSLLFYPEIAYDNRLGAQSASVTAGVTEGRAFGSYSGRWVGQEFTGLDRPTYFYHLGLNNEHEANIGYDLRDNLRASLYQVHRRTESNSLSNFELRTSYTGDIMPDIELAASGLFSENNPGTEMSNRNNKKSFSLRLSDLSARYIKETKGIHSLGYDVSWTEYNSDSLGRGRVAYGMVNVSPISSLTFTGTTVHRRNPAGFDTRSESNPQISVNTRNLPPGFDIGAAYSVYVTEFAAGGSGLVAGGNIGGYIYPGEYTDALERLALYLSYSQKKESLLPAGAQPMEHIFFSDELAVAKHAWYDAGLLFFPLDNMLLSTLNSIYRNIYTGEIDYYTSEGLSFWLQNGSKLEAVAVVDKSQTRDLFHADARYEHRWASGLMTGIGAFGLYQTIKDSTDANIKEAGPILTASLTKDLSGYIRNVENSHYLRISAVRGDGLPVPEIEYTVYIRLKMPPDISIVAELGADIQGQKAGNFGAGVYLHAGF
jgi:hypothetical protein